MTSNADDAAAAPLWVWIYLPRQSHPVLCGRFERTLVGAGPVGSFTYGRHYLARPDRLPIDPVALPLQPKRFDTAYLSGWFSVLLDAGPDAWGRRLIDRSAGPQDERGYLLKARGQLVGALAFSETQDAPPPPAHSTTPPTFEYTLALHAKVEQGAKLSAAETEQLLGEAGSGGARPKLTLEENGSLWLVKGSSVNDNPDYSPVPCVEGALLTLADACDIRVPRHDVRRIAGSPVLLVERFDRYRLDDGSFGRWRYASAQTLFWSKPEVARYSYQGSYTNLARHLRVWERNPDDDVRELYRRVVFNALVGNTDDHDKNHGVIANAGGDFVMAPAFDLTISSTPGARNYLALSFGESGGDISLENLLSNCELFGYTPGGALEIVHAQWNTISTRLVETLVRYGSAEEKAARTAAQMPGHQLLAAT
jgi:serine/threonine-protein kinase HipA